VSAISLSAAWRDRPLVTRAVRVILLLAILQAIVAAGAWWLTEDWLFPKGAPSDVPAAATERLADLYAAAAVRLVAASDAAALAQLVKRAAAWPEVVYVGVEDAQGRVLAHTDPARVGTIWYEVTSTKIRAAAGAAHREVAVPIVDAAQKDGPALGRIRLGYIALGGAATNGGLAGGHGSILVVTLAVAAAVPLGALIAYVTNRPAAASAEAPSQSLESLAQATWSDRERLVAEIRRLKESLAEHAPDPGRLEPAPALPAPAAPPAPAGAMQEPAILSVAQAVRTSLTNILGFSKLLLRETDGSLTESQSADVLSIQRAGVELLRLVAGLSELSRAEAGLMPVQPEPVDPRALLHELAADCGSAHSLDIKVECPPDLPMVRADRGHLVQILHTLIMQATALDGHGEVTLRPRTDASTLHITVAHPGRAIPEDAVATFFEPFAGKESSGTRVGLALARALARLNGGGVGVAQPPGEGVVFTVDIPLETDAAPRPA
jgi:signal transduction histidine kinase